MSAADGPFHAGERAVQNRAGVADMAARVGRSIHDRLPDRAAEFLRAAPLLVSASLDRQGRLWAAAHVGGPDVVGTPDAQTLTLRAALHDPIGGEPARPGDLLGILAIDPATRRRARVNGRIRQVRGDVLEIEIEEAYANCPKYIQARTPVAAAPGVDPDAASRAAVLRGSRLTEAQLRAIRRADTLFIATAHPERGADASHRGGGPGFVSAGPGRVSWPDYPGNTMFNTLGNIESYGRAGLLFIDFETGRTLQITGRAEVGWETEDDRSASAIGRPVTVDVEEVIERRRGLPLRFRFGSYSPHNPPTGGDEVRTRSLARPPAHTGPR